MNQRDRIAMQLIDAPPPIEEESPPSYMTDEARAAIEAAIGPAMQPGYAEGEVIPQENPPGTEAWTQPPPLPPTIMGEEPPEWARHHQGIPTMFMRSQKPRV